MVLPSMSYSDTQLTAVQELADAAGKQEHLSQKEGYQEWLQQAAQGSLRPIYRSIKAHEAQVVRPFLDRPFELRPYLQFCQWQKIWGSSGDLVDPVIPQLRQQAIQEAEKLAPVSFNKLHKVVKTLCKKAPGPDGWTNGLLRKLPSPAIEDLLNLFKVVETTGLMPQLWRTSQIALLVKNQDIERSIALRQLKTRYHLVNKWYMEPSTRSGNSFQRRPNKPLPQPASGSSLTRMPQVPSMPFALDGFLRQHPEGSGHKRLFGMGLEKLSKDSPVSLVTLRGLQRLTLSTVTVPTRSGHSHFSRHCSSESVWLEPKPSAA